ncbi:hypothetical protein MJG53_005025, partial [Ovis ammon polii x Ovis aries]
MRVLLQQQQMAPRLPTKDTRLQHCGEFYCNSLQFRLKNKTVQTLRFRAENLQNLVSTKLMEDSQGICLKETDPSPVPQNPYPLPPPGSLHTKMVLSMLARAKTINHFLSSCKSQLLGEQTFKPLRAKVLVQSLSKAFRNKCQALAEGSEKRKGSSHTPPGQFKSRSHCMRSKLASATGRRSAHYSKAGEDVKSQKQSEDKDFQGLLNSRSSSQKLPPAPSHCPDQTKMMYGPAETELDVSYPISMTQALLYGASDNSDLSIETYIQQSQTKSEDQDTKGKGHTPTYCPYRSISDEQKVNPGWNLALEKPELQVRYVIGLYLWEVTVNKDPLNVYYGSNIRRYLQWPWLSSTFTHSRFIKPQLSRYTCRK